MGPSCTKLLPPGSLFFALGAAPQLPWLRGGRRGGRRQPGDARVPDQPGPGLTGGIPASLGRLASLQSLVLVENRLTGAVPAELGALARLRRLVLSGNGLSGQIPATLGNDPSDELLIVDMSNNSLTGSLPSPLGGLKGLLKMDISNNLLHGSLPPELAGLGSLTLLDLRNNSFTGGLPPFLQGMASLQDLLLSNNPLAGRTSRPPQPRDAGPIQSRSRRGHTGIHGGSDQATVLGARSQPTLRRRAAQPRRAVSERQQPDGDAAVLAGVVHGPLRLASSLLPSSIASGIWWSSSALFMFLQL